MKFHAFRISENSTFLQLLREKKCARAVSTDTRRLIEVLPDTY